MKVADAYYHGIRHQVRRVLSAMTDDEIDRGIDAFETGSSNWSHCFFARALDMDEHKTEWHLAIDPQFPRVEAPTIWIRNRLKLESHVPVRIVWHLFDGLGSGRTMSRDELKQLIVDLREDRRPAEVLELLRSLDLGIDEQKPIEVSC